MRVLRELGAAGSLPSKGARVERAEAIERMSANPQQKQPEPKRQIDDTLRREIDRAARQLEGLSKSLKRLNERIKEAA